MQAVNFDLSKYPIPTRQFIHGEWVDSKRPDKKSMRSAVNDALITDDLQWASEDDVDAAVESATKGLEAWQAMTERQRRDALWKYAALMRQHADELFWLEAVLTGKERGFSRFEEDKGAEEFTYFSTLIDSFHGQIIRAQDDAIEYTLRQPYGVCAAIVPFNGPIICYCMKVAPALAAGNSIIVKASETNPFSTMFLASLSVQAGIPPGVINCLVGGGDVGAALASHMAIRKISFTGSIATAKLVQIAAAKSNLKSVTLELGGKSPIIIFDDADLETAAKAACGFLTLNGQGCMLATRLYIHESIKDVILPKVLAIVQAYEKNLGSNPLDSTTWSSPLFHARQKEIVLSYIESGKSEATLLTGGEKAGDLGHYVQPCVFIDPKPDARILKEEVFGPLLVVSTFKTDDEVLAWANDSEFGLGAFLWTSNMARALRFSYRLETGTVGINGVNWSPQTPFGGWKQSGQGVENGHAGLDDWLQTKSIRLNMNSSNIAP
ncbi:hypothetical protein N7490_008261 [Penicillium lividum]|nr:hypothetical protein N7490_008261 [Penicillium lividum]